MRRDSIHSLKRGSVRKISFTHFAFFLCLLMFPSLAFCNVWEPMGPEGGNFIFSMTNPANANEVTAMTTSPSPSNVYKSHDAGMTWNKIGEIPYRYVYNVSAFNYSTLYAITSSYCFSSTDGGISWFEARLPSSQGYARHVCVHPTNSRIVFAIGVYYNYNNNPTTYHMAFFKSIDGGRNWSSSQFFTFDYFYPYDMAISESNPNVMYVTGYKQVGNDYFGAMLATSDGGNTWTDISSDVDRERYTRFTSIAIDPTDEEKVYVGGDYFYRGVKSSGRDSGLTWSRNSAARYIYSICIDPIDPSRIHLGMYESMATSTNYGLSWTTRNNISIKRAAEHITVAPGDPSQIYISSYAGLYKSSNFGADWNTTYNGIYAARINAMDVDPRMILVQTSGYLISYGRGRNNSWEDVVTPESCGEVCDILINPENPNTVLILEGYG